ncbi:MAG: HNH endonuclease [Candidatus Solibacter sp.]
MDQQRTLENYWRAVILFGQNVASYKFALAKSLIDLSAAGQAVISLEALADPFSRHIVDHLAKAPKQATSASSRFLDACRTVTDRDKLIGATVKLGFNNVIDAFHVVNRGDIPVRFFVDERSSGGGIRLTDELFRLREHVQFVNLPHEVEARWRLVETAWQLEMSRNALAVDVDGLELVVTRSGRRTSLTGCRDALNGYQKGKCFYCFCDIEIHRADVDHFLPHTLKQLNLGLPVDGVWNLVLTCRDCNRGVDGKSSRVPRRRLLERLDTRNEFFIGSHHPLRETLLAQTGQTRVERTQFLNGAYDTAWQYLIHTWQPEFEHAPAF